MLQTAASLFRMCSVEVNATLIWEGLEATGCMSGHEGDRWGGAGGDNLGEARGAGCLVGMEVTG